MAITKIIVLKRRLDKAIKYVLNEAKTLDLSDALDYIDNPTKNEKHLFEGTLNCIRETAFEDMVSTKKRFNKLGGVQGYHFIQSFAPDEVTPELAHQIGREFCESLFGDRFEVAYSTHLDKKHLHNHIIINSVSFVDGKKYHINIGQYYNKVRVTSDALCKKYKLSVIENPAKDRPRSSHNQYKQNHQAGASKYAETLRSLLCRDIDEAISKSILWDEFIVHMRKKGYEVKTDVKYISFRAPGSERFIRLRSLDAAYSEESLRERILGKKEYRKPVETVESAYYRPIQIRKYSQPQKRYSRTQHVKCSGYMALYYKYSRRIRDAQRRKHPQYRFSYHYLSGDIQKFHKLNEAFLFLYHNNIHTMDELNQKRASVRSEISLRNQRVKHYTLMKNTPFPSISAEECDNLIAQEKRAMGQLRRIMSLCKDIETRSVDYESRNNKCEVADSTHSNFTDKRSAKDHNRNKENDQRRN